MYFFVIHVAYSLGNVDAYRNIDAHNSSLFAIISSRAFARGITVARASVLAISVATM